MKEKEKAIYFELKDESLKTFSEAVQVVLERFPDAIIRSLSFEEEIRYDRMAVEFVKVIKGILLV